MQGFQHAIYVSIHDFLWTHVNNCTQIPARIYKNPAMIYNNPERIYKNPARTESHCNHLLISCWTCMFSCRISRVSCRPVLVNKKTLRRSLQSRRCPSQGGLAWRRLGWESMGRLCWPAQAQATGLDKRTKDGWAWGGLRQRRGDGAKGQRGEEGWWGQSPLQILPNRQLN